MQQDLFVVFDEEEKNFEENIPPLNQNMDEFLGKDFIKYLSEKNNLPDRKKSFSNVGKQVSNPEVSEKPQLFTNVEYEKLDTKTEYKKDELKRLKECLLKIVEDKNRLEKSSTFTRYSVGGFYPRYPT